MRGITVMIPACEKLSQMLLKRDMVLTIRDTRGMLDMAVDRKSDGKMNVTVPSLSNLGLDGVNAVLFMGAKTMQDSVAELYRDILETVLKAVPVFILYRDSCIGDKEIADVEAAKECVEKLRKRPGYMYTRLYETMCFLESLKIVEKDSKDNKFHYQSFDFFSLEDTEYVVPECECLFRKKAGLEVTENSDYVSYSAFARFTVLDIVDKLWDYYEKILCILQSDELIEELRCHREEFGEIVVEDFRKYTHGRKSRTMYVRPCVEYKSVDLISQDLVNKDVEILGERGGITTTVDRSDSEMKYAATAISAVALRCALKSWLLRDDFCGKLPSELRFAEEEKHITNKALNYILYKQFIDTDATIQYYLFVDRWIMYTSIQCLKENQIPAEKAVYELARNLCDAFCARLSDLQSADMWKLIKYNRENTV